jgi:hypothetical protein
MSINREKCAVCYNVLMNIYTLDNVPICLSCVDTPDTKIFFDKMSFSICTKCNTIQLDKLVPLNLLYQTSHNAMSVGKT